MTFTVACHVFGGKLFGNPRFWGAGNSKLKIEKVNTSFTSFAGLKKSLSFALASPGKTFIFMHNST